MKNIGIELISSINIVNKIAAYTGGTNYAKILLRAIEHSINDRDIALFIYLPEGFIPDSESMDLFSGKQGQLRYATDIRSCDFNDLDVLFLPQVNGTVLRDIPKIRAKYINLKIYATLHDRQHNFYKYDWHDRFFYSGIRRTGIPDFIMYYMKKMVFDLEYMRCIECIDKIFTVSNCSMQRLIHKNVQNIKYFVPKSILDEQQVKEVSRGDYILLVGGGRPEKNLLRAIEAYFLYQKKTNKSLKLKVTGVSDATKSNLLKYIKHINRENLDLIEFLPYLTYVDLAKLYANCRYTVFISKGEGYGIPVREAMNYGKTVIASRTTSVPEVAGAAMVYVDPFSIKSICNGFILLDSDDVLDRYEGYIKDRRELIRRMADKDTEILIDEIIN